MASKRPAVRFRYAPQVAAISGGPSQGLLYFCPMTPSQVGERAEAALVSALVSPGVAVYLPFGGSQRCDLVFEDDKGLHRVQVKNGLLRGPVIDFATCSNTKNVPKGYQGQIEYFGVYCHELAAAFLVPFAVVPTRSARLRVGAPRSQQQRGIRWAEQFRLDWSPPRLDDDPDIPTAPDKP